MGKRYGVAITIAYGLAFGAAMTADNLGYDVATMSFALWLAAPAIGFVVGRWWAVLAVIGVLIGHAIGWDKGENDGNPAFWFPYVLAQLVLIGGPIGFGALVSAMWRGRKRPATGGPTRPTH